MADACHTCELVARRDRGEAPLWDRILRTPHFDVVHSYNTSLPGWIVVVSRRHLAAIDEMDGAEAGELGTLIRDVSLALKKLVKCEKTYVMQFAEAEGHGHFHVVPRASDMPLENRSGRWFNYLGVDPSDQLSDATMNDVASRLRPLLQGT